MRKWYRHLTCGTLLHEKPKYDQHANLNLSNNDPKHVTWHEKTGLYMYKTTPIHIII